MDEKKYELVVCIINSGFNEVVMNAARNCGAKGGTVINARGTANEELASRFNYSITPEKEIVLLVVPVEIKDDILHALYKEVGMNSQAQGVFFTVPVDETAGIGKHSKEGEKPKSMLEEKEEKKEEIKEGE